MIKIGIIGGTGYTGVELLRLLAQHPQVELKVITSRGDAGKPVDAPSVTVLVTLPQAELLTLAGNEGRIQLVLRNGGDQVVEETKGLSLIQLYGSHSRNVDGAPQRNRDDLSLDKPKTRRAPVAIAATPPPPLPPPVAVPDQIIVIRGIEKRVETMPAKKSMEEPGRNP